MGQKWNERMKEIDDEILNRLEELHIENITELVIFLNEDELLNRRALRAIKLCQREFEIDNINQKIGYDGYFFYLK